MVNSHPTRLGVKACLVCCFWVFGPLYASVAAYTIRVPCSIKRKLSCLCGNVQMKVRDTFRISLCVSYLGSRSEKHICMKACILTRYAGCLQQNVRRPSHRGVCFFAWQTVQREAMLAADSGHDDYVLDAKYDYYGRRFATCSSDHSIRVWDQVPEGGWRVTSRIPKVSIDEMYATSVHPCSASRGSGIMRG